MNNTLMNVQNNVEPFDQKTERDVIFLYPGIQLCYVTISTGSFSARHKPIPHVIQINYCKAGQLMWDMKNGARIYLNPGDFSLHPMKACTDSVLTFSNNTYQGLTIYIDLLEASGNPPEVLNGQTIFETVLPERLCPDNKPAFLAGNEQSERIFSGFYNQPKALALPYQKIKVLELLLYLSKMEFTPQTKLDEYQFELTESVRNIHDQLLRHMDQRITIEELSRQYLINPTTLKNAFKSVYGTSIGAHMKEHRMRQAARMLIESNMKIAEIALAVGYDSQSKFATAFKAYFKVLPREYRKK